MNDNVPSHVSENVFPNEIVNRLTDSSIIMFPLRRVLGFINIIWNRSISLRKLVDGIILLLIVLLTYPIYWS